MPIRTYNGPTLADLSAICFFRLVPAHAMTIVSRTASELKTLSEYDPDLGGVIFRLRSHV